MNSSLHELARRHAHQMHRDAVHQAMDTLLRALHGGAASIKALLGIRQGRLDQRSLNTWA
jgi:hypothetical protein